MSLPVFFPNVRYVPSIEGQTTPLSQVCETAGVACAAIGRWTQRPLLILEGAEPSITSEPDDWGVVKIVTPLGLAQRGQARWALGAMAYVLFDGVARASIAKQAWSRPETPRGRKPSNHKPLTNAQRQKKYRNEKTQKNQ